MTNRSLDTSLLPMLDGNNIILFVKCRAFGINVDGAAHQHMKAENGSMEINYRDKAKQSEKNIIGKSEIASVKTAI